MKEFEKALKDESFGYVSQIVENSKKMLKATVNGTVYTIWNSNSAQSGTYKATLNASFLILSSLFVDGKYFISKSPNIVDAFAE